MLKSYFVLKTFILNLVRTGGSGGVVGVPLVPALGGNRNNQTRTAEKTVVRDHHLRNGNLQSVQIL